MTEVYAVIWGDRHVDTSVYIFSDSGDAIKWACARAYEYCRGEKIDGSLTADMMRSGWLYNGTYSSEGDSIRVVKVTIDAEKGKGD